MPQEEVAISQLAVLENFAEHLLYVKFDDGEAAALEEQALAQALRESAAAADAPSAGPRCGDGPLEHGLQAGADASTGAACLYVRAGDPVNCRCQRREGLTNTHSLRKSRQNWCFIRGALATACRDRTSVLPRATSRRCCCQTGRCVHGWALQA